MFDVLRACIPLFLVAIVNGGLSEPRLFFCEEVLRLSNSATFQSARFEGGLLAPLTSRVGGPRSDRPRRDPPPPTHLLTSLVLVYKVYTF